MLLGCLYIFVPWLGLLTPGRCLRAQKWARFDQLSKRRCQGSCCSNGPMGLRMDTSKHHMKALRLCGCISIIGGCCIRNREFFISSQIWTEKKKTYEVMAKRLPKMGRRKQVMLEIWTQSVRKAVPCEMAREGKRCHPLWQKPMQFLREMFNQLLVMMVKQDFLQDMVVWRLHWQETLESCHMEL